MSEQFWQLKFPGVDQMFVNPHYEASIIPCVGMRYLLRTQTDWYINFLITDMTYEESTNVYLIKAELFVDAKDSKKEQARAAAEVMEVLAKDAWGFLSVEDQAVIDSHKTILVEKNKEDSKSRREEFDAKVIPFRQPSKS